MHRFYVEPGQSNSPQIALSEREAHHALTVLRLQAGDRVVALDGEGHELLCQLEPAGKNKANLRVYQRNIIPPLPAQITLIQAIPKGKNMETIVQKAAEIGASRVVPLLAERSVPQLDEGNVESKVEKWRWVAIDAIKQCGSAWLPKIELPIKPAQFMGQGERFELSLLATLQTDARHPQVHWRDFIEERQRKPKSIAVWVGPEGDFTPAEINAIRNTGALPITLGPLILRSETAAIYCLSVLSYELHAPL